MQAAQSPEALSRRNNRVVIRNLFVIDIPCFFNALKGFPGQNLTGKAAYRFKPLKSLDIPVYLLCHSRRKHPGICTGISDQLFLVQLLNHLQRFIRTDFKHPGAVILQLCQVVQQRRVLCLLLFFHLNQTGSKGLCLLQSANQRLCILPFLKSVFLVKQGRLKISRSLCTPPFSVKAHALHIKVADYTVKGCLYKITNFPFPSDHHAKNTGHHSADG